MSNRHKTVPSYFKEDLR